MNGEAFTTYVTCALVPELSLGNVVIMDNLSIHKAPAVCALYILTLSDAIAFGVGVGVVDLGSTAVIMAVNPSVPRPLDYGFLRASYFVVASILITVMLLLIC